MCVQFSPAELHAQLQNLRPEAIGALPFAAAIGIEEDQRVQIAITGVEHVHASQAVAFLHGLDRLEHGAERLARNRPVHAVIVGGNAARRGKCVLAPGPEAQALAFGARYGNGSRAGLPEHALHFRDFPGHLIGRAIGLRQQDRRGRQVVARVDERLDGGRCFPIHHLQAGGDDSGRDDRGNRLAGFTDIVVGSHHDAGQLRSGDQFQQHLGDDQQQPFRADGHRQQIESGSVRRAAPELDRFSIDGIAADTEYVVNRESVFQAVDPSGILRDVASDRASQLRGRIGRVIQGVGCGGFGDLEVTDTRLHARCARSRVDIENAIQSCQRQHHTARVRRRSSGQAGPCATRDDRNVVLTAGQQYIANLCVGSGQRDRHRDAAKCGESVALVGAQLVFVRENAVGGKNGPQGLNHRFRGAGREAAPWIAPGRLVRERVLAEIGVRTHRRES